MPCSISTKTTFGLFLSKGYISDSNHTAESIGKEYLHDKVEENIGYLDSCVEQHGVTGCIFLTMYTADAPDNKVADMLRIGCYYIFIEQILKFVKV